MRVFIFIIFFACIVPACESGNDEDQAADANQMGLQFENEGKPEAAIKAFRLAASYPYISDSSRAIYIGNIAISYENLEIIDSARFYYRKAADLYGAGSYGYLVSIANLCLADNKIDSAVMLLNRAYGLRKDGHEVNNLLGLIYIGAYDTSHFNPEKALPYNIVASDESIVKSTLYTLGKNYYMLNKVNEAHNFFTEAYKQQPFNVNYLTTLIIIEQEMGNKAKADELLKKLKTLDIEEYEEMINDPVEKGEHAIVW